jgi:hypothetical protein
MSKVKKVIFVGVITVFTLSLLLATGCSRHPNDEQIQAMEEARSACLAAEQKLSEVQGQRASLERQLDAKKADLDEANKEKEKVMQGLANWSSEE